MKNLGLSASLHFSEKTASSNLKIKRPRAVVTTRSFKAACHRRVGLGPPDGGMREIIFPMKLIVQGPGGRSPPKR